MTHFEHVIGNEIIVFDFSLNEYSVNELFTKDYEMDSYKNETNHTIQPVNTKLFFTFQRIKFKECLKNTYMSIFLFKYLIRRIKENLQCFVSFSIYLKNSLSQFISFSILICILTKEHVKKVSRFFLYSLYMNRFYPKLHQQMFQQT